MKRRLFVAAAAAQAAVAWAQTPGWSLEARQRLLGGPAAARAQALAERERLLDEGERRLADGDAAAASRHFEAATQILHAADAELSLVRAQLQSGEYRRALAFAAHAAGAHLDVIDGTLLYAWLLHVGGQGRYASRLLSEAAVRRPDAVALAQARAALGSDWPRATGALAHGVGRAAPYAWGAEVDATSRVVGTALLLDDGRRALAPAALIDGARALWLRNGLGQTVRTQVERADGEAVATLRLEAPLAAPGPLVASAREPFAGSPGFLIEYAPGEGPAWPLLRQGFFARPARDGGPRPLDLGVPGSPGGGPVFDAAGRIAGIAVGGHLHPLADQLAAAPPTTARIGVDELYERGLRIALQLIARPRAAVASATSGASAND